MMLCSRLRNFSNAFGRYLMYKYRIITFLILTGTFWTVEVTFAAFVWFALSVWIFPQNETILKKEENVEVKRERGEGDESDVLSDTPRTFPTLTGQPPLRYSSPRIKSEGEEDTPLIDTHAATAEADDEDEDADFLLEESAPIGRGVSDSGIGTSMESSTGKPGSLRRRISKT
jgi:seipin